MQEIYGIILGATTPQLCVKHKVGPLNQQFECQSRPEIRSIYGANCKRVRDLIDTLYRDTV